MKTLKNKFWALLLIASVAFLSCKKEDRLSPYANSNNSIVEDRTVIGRNDWKITVYRIGKTSEVNLFNEYIFKFNKGPEILALTSNSKDYGTWQVGRAGEKVTIHFDSKPLAHLNNTYRILNKTAYDIILTGVNRNGDPVSLSFQRFQRVGDLPTISEEPTDPDIPHFE